MRSILSHIPGNICTAAIETKSQKHLSRNKIINHVNHKGMKNQTGLRQEMPEAKEGMETGQEVSVCVQLKNCPEL